VRRKIFCFYFSKKSKNILSVECEISYVVYSYKNAITINILYTSDEKFIKIARIFTGFRMTIWIFASSLIDYTRFFAVARMLKVGD